jgi:hypothetical protein
MIDKTYSVGNLPYQVHSKNHTGTTLGFDPKT